MSLPIKETPILTGKAARKFAHAVANPKPVMRAEYERAKAIYLACTSAGQ